MKKNLAYLLLIFIANSSFCQAYEPIVDTTKMWVVFNNSSALPANYGQTSAFKIKDSVLLDDHKYWYKVFESSDSLYAIWKFNGYMRELNKIVLYKNDLWGIDTIYNFNAVINDKLQVDIVVVIKMKITL